MKKRLAEMTAAVALKSAKSAAGAASDWTIYQPKEPKMIKKMIKK